MFLGQSEVSKPMDVSIHLWWGTALGCDVPGASIHDVELLTTLVGAGVGVRVVIDGLECPLGVLELHVLLFVTLRGNMLLAFLLPGRRAVMAWLLLLLLMKLLRKLPDLTALLCTMASGVVYRAPQTTLITARGLPQLLVTTWATAHTSCCSSGSGSTSQRLVVAADLLLLLFVFAAALSSGICIGLSGFPCLWGRL
jgi:hypothetical protein